MSWAFSERPCAPRQSDNKAKAAVALAVVRPTPPLELAELSDRRHGSWLSLPVANSIVA